VRAHDLDLGPPGDDGDEIEEAARLDRQRGAPRENRVAYAGGHGLAIGPQQLGDVKRVAARERE
jgi:hypothetical protein